MVRDTPRPGIILVHMSTFIIQGWKREGTKVRAERGQRMINDSESFHTIRRKRQKSIPLLLLCRDNKNYRLVELENNRLSRSNCEDRGLHSLKANTQAEVPAVLYTQRTNNFTCMYCYLQTNLTNCKI